MSKASVAAVLIVKNEGENLRACLQSVAGWVDEIVILDSGSSDNTADIAAEFNAKYEIEPSWQGYGRQRQMAQERVSSDWCFWLDADERVTPQLQESIQSILSNPTENVAYTVPRLNWVFGRYIRHCGWYPDRVIRFYPTRLTRYNAALVHEKVEINNQIALKPLTGDLLHIPYKNLEHYLVKSARYAKAWADGREAKGKTTSLWQGIIHAIGCFLRMYLLRTGFLDGKAGFLLSVLSAHSTFVKYADLWSRKQKNKPD
ncbi:glycosyltransferase family 2 protein [Tolumonas lignilytica]|uniref:glycosyltransferase family 2 protein n=1 Tax=Tolumonas lignilytica TaxID=1283284 RepID=UPI000467727B|nr:glycosyltransferase family 2 protein [Tolumonas lignilytica]